jgi:hypothetical protein
MKLINKLLGSKEKKISGTKSPVYVFFAEADAKEKAKAYRKALRSASKEQMLVLTKFDKELAQSN